MNRADKLLAAALLLLALAGLVLTYQQLFSSDQLRAPAQAIISVRGKVVQRVELRPGGARSTFVLPGRLGPTTIAVEGGRIHVDAAPCPNQLCVSQGWIEHPGESIICLPGEIVIRIDGPATVDAVSR